MEIWHRNILTAQADDICRRIVLCVFVSTCLFQDCRKFFSKMLSPVRNVAINYCRLFSTRSNVCAASIKNIEPSKSTLQPPEADEKKSNNQLGVLDDGGQVFTGFTYYPRFVVLAKFKKMFVFKCFPWLIF